MKTNKEKPNTGRNYIAIVAQFRQNAGAFLDKTMKTQRKNTRELLEDYEEEQEIQQSLYDVGDYYENGDDEEVRYHFGSEIKNTPKFVKK